MCPHCGVSRSARYVGTAELWPRGLRAAVRNLANLRPPSTPVSAESAPTENDSAPGTQRASALFTTAVVLAGATIVAYALGDLATRPISHEWLMLLALTVASDLATQRIPGMPISFSI